MALAINKDLLRNGCSFWHDQLQTVIFRSQVRLPKGNCCLTSMPGQGTDGLTRNKRPHLVAAEAHALEFKSAAAGLVRAEVEVFQPGAESWSWEDGAAMCCHSRGL